MTLYKSVYYYYYYYYCDLVQKYNRVAISW